MIDKPMTTDDLFNNICDSLKEKGKWPEILDYALGENERYAVELKTSDIELKNNLDYGGSEGIYLDLWLDIYDEENSTSNKVKFGTFKTLEDGDKAMHIMATLLADFILEEKRYVREHRADFNWKGMCFYPADENGQEYGWGRYCYTDQELEEQKKVFLEKYPMLIIRNFETREEFIYKREPENNFDIER